MNNYLSIIGFAAAVFFTSCKHSGSSQEQSNPWEIGSAQISADKNLEPVLSQFAEAFEHEFPRARLTFAFNSNDSLVHKFIAGEIHCMIITRELNTNESQYASMAQDIKIRQNVFAYSGIALVAGKNFPDSLFDLSLLKNYLSGNRLEIVFDNAQSGIAKFMMQKLEIDPALLKNARSAGSIDALVKYVQQKQNAVGCMPFSYISNPGEKSARTILDAVKVLDVKWHDSTFVISQESIAFGDYPLKVPFNFVRGSQYDPLADGFASYLYKHRAAKILLRAGLVPANIPARTYNISEKLPQ